MLLPKSTGLFLVADSQIDEMDYIYDLTMGYSGLEKEDIPYEEYLIDNVFFSDYYPERVHINVRRFKISEIPGMKDKQSPLKIDKNNKFDDISEKRRLQFSDWMIQRFMEKDELMKHFYERGRFQNDEHELWKPKPSLDDTLLISILLGSSLILVPLLLRIAFGILLVTFTFCKYPLTLIM